MAQGTVYPGFPSCRIFEEIKEVSLFLIPQTVVLFPDQNSKQTGEAAPVLFEIQNDVLRKKEVFNILKNI